MTEHEHAFLHALDERIHTLRQLEARLMAIPQAFTDAITALNTAIATIPAQDPNAVSAADVATMVSDVQAATTAVQAKATPAA